MTRRPSGARGVFGDVRRRPQRDDRFEFLTIERWATHVQALVAPWAENAVSLPSRKGKRK
jgi:hypothetical protein